jgi:hypothetical protein
MNVQLQKAVAAIRAGKKDEARALLDGLAATDPKNVHVLFLLSTVAHGPDEQIAFVRQVLELDPNHVGAQKRLAQLQTKVMPAPSAASSAQDVALPVSDKMDDFLAQAEADSLPPWLAGEEGALAASFPPAGELPQVDLLGEPEDLPDWLQEEPAQEWMSHLGMGQKPSPWNTGGPQQSEAVSSTPAEPATTRGSTPATAPASAPPTSWAPSTKRLLLGLTLLTLIVAALFVYVFSTTFLVN